MTTILYPLPAFLYATLSATFAFPGFESKNILGVLRALGGKVFILLGGLCVLGGKAVAFLGALAALALRLLVSLVCLAPWR